MQMNLPLRALRTATFVVGMGVVALACTSDTKDSATDSAVTGACTGPVAAAGADLTGTPGTGVSLDGTASVVCDATTVVYIWAFEAVPTGSGVDAGDLDVTDPAHPSFEPDLAGTYVLSLIVSDASGVTSTADLVVITVAAGSATPTAECGGPYAGEVGLRIDLDGTASTDPEGDALSYLWAITATPNGSALQSSSVYHADTATASFVPDVSGVFTVGLIVSDGETWSEPSFCRVDIGEVNDRPVADAGTTGDLSPCTEHNYELNGFGSYDPEGQPLVYQWSLLSSPAGSTTSAASFSDATIPNPIFTWDVNGEYTFELRVNDGITESAPDIVVHNFQPAEDNAIPIANAGEDQTINKSPECETASYVFTCEDCPAEDVEVDGSASDDAVDGDDLTFLWDQDNSNQLTFGSPTAPTTTVFTPSFASEYGVVTTRTWDVTLSVSDCADTDTDTVRITYNCTGTYN